MIFEKLVDIISEQFSVEPDTITRETSFADDLGADSLDLVELLMTLEDEFNCDAEDCAVDTICTVGDAEDLIRERTEQN